MKLTKKKKEFVKIEKDFYDFLKEQTLKKVEVQKELTYVRWLLEVEKTKGKLTRDDLKLYYDYIDNNWWYLSKEEKADELQLISLVERRTPAQEEGFRSFLRARKELEEDKEADDK